MSDGGVENTAFDGERTDLAQHQQLGKTYNGTVDGRKQSPLDKLKVTAKQHERIIWNGFYVALNAVIIAYFAYATYFYLEKQECSPNCEIEWCDGYGWLTLMFAVTYVGYFYFKIGKKYIGGTIDRTLFKPMRQYLRKVFRSKYAKGAVCIFILALFLTYIIIDTKDSRERLVSLLGIASILTFGFVFSKHPTKVNWRPVICGVFLQIVLGMVCIRWSVGRDIFDCAGKKAAIFLNFAGDGSKFVFSTQLTNADESIFAFTALPVVIFFSSCISILYYFGTMQWVLTKLGWVLQSILGTTVCESVNAAANIVIGQSEAPLLIRPYLKILTCSEIHAIMTSGFATVSGSVLAAYISFGADPSHLITASVMAAPTSLYFSKLFFPETEESSTRSDNIQMEKSQDKSALDAATNGAINAIPLVLGIVANIIAFVAIVAFLNAVIGWFGDMVGLEGLSLVFLFGKLFIPLAWVIGIPWDECEAVGQLIGTKTMVNEFVAYQKLGEFKRDNIISERSAAVATFALCGFANPSSLGIMIGALGAIAPEQKKNVTTVAVRALIAGSCVCFLTASLASLLMTDDIFVKPNKNTLVNQLSMNNTLFL